MALPTLVCVPLPHAAGDVRMRFGENPNKVRNIVAAQRDLLHAIYVPVALGRAFGQHVTQLADGTFQVSIDPGVRKSLETQTFVSCSDRSFPSGPFVPYHSISPSLRHSLPSHTMSRHPQQDKSPAARARHVQLLPSNLLRRIAARTGAPGVNGM